VRHIFLILLAALLFSSCTLTKRRYLPGYALNWAHKTPGTLVNKTPVLSKPQITCNQAGKIATKELHKLPNVSDKLRVSSKTNSLNTLHINKKPSIPNVSVANEPFLYTHTVLPGDTNNPHFFTGDEQGDDHARYSLTFGILSIAIPALTYMILFVIAISSGGSFTTSLTIAIILFLLGILAGLFFSVMAYIQGNKAIKEINAYPDIYEGKGKAIWGMVLASILPILLVVYLIIKH
jgi:hypothetical protein